ncbi:MAG TPA: C-GCAxxG-C-C family protein [Nitrospirota bacterium]|nr:C-GCAxxG-C-C family protein [Nitrospirota bacterium]
MDDVAMRMVELSSQGFYCSQILIILALEAQGKSNPDLVRTMTGLASGIGGCGKICGTLTGGACLLALYAGKGTPGEQGDSRMKPMITELVEWFEQECTARFNTGINCADILQDDAPNILTRCPQLVLATFEKAKEILERNGFDFSGAQ